MTLNERLNEAFDKRVGATTTIEQLESKLRDLETAHQATLEDRDDWRTYARETGKQNVELRKQRDALLKALEENEWTEFSDSDWGLVEFCPECRNEKKHGHGDDCTIAAAIASARGAV